MTAQEMLGIVKNSKTNIERELKLAKESGLSSNACVHHATATLNLADGQQAIAEFLSNGLTQVITTTIERVMSTQLEAALNKSFNRYTADSLDKTISSKIDKALNDVNRRQSGTFMRIGKSFEISSRSAFAVVACVGIIVIALIVKDLSASRLRTTNNQLAIERIEDTINKMIDNKLPSSANH